jgi:hypothetical protein
MISLLTHIYSRARVLILRALCRIGTVFLTTSLTSMHAVAIESFDYALATAAIGSPTTPPGIYDASPRPAIARRLISAAAVVTQR